MQNKPMWKSKTFWTGIAGIIAGIGAYVVGEVTLSQFISIEIVPVALIFLRDALRK